MSSRSKWIWLYGDYEIFHSLLVHERRQEFGVDYPYFGVQSHVYPSVTFEKGITTDIDGEVTFYVNGKAYIVFDGVFYPAGKTIRYNAGAHYIFIRVTNPRGLPAIFAEGDIATDESWSCGVNGYIPSPVGATPAYTSKTDNVEIFPFAYARKEPISCIQREHGWLYDFGAEMFAKLYVTANASNVGVYYGESVEEATATDNPDPTQNALLFEYADIDGERSFPSRAFRYVYVLTEKKPQSVYAESEYLPVNNQAVFVCENARINRVFDVAADTFLLTSREFYLDGIKRDRWVWAGDAYQSFMMNRYATNDAEIIKRTILALLGKPPYVEHINTINDYTFYLMISVYDYWYSTGDTGFIEKIFARLKALYEFAVSRLDENGLVCKKKGDWIFIDWSESLDKEGPICAEQILLWKATKCMKELACAVQKSVPALLDEEALKRKIYELYYKPELGGFIDAFISGKNQINRQQNVLALLYHFTSEEEGKRILEQVLCNTSVPPITTPYFKFFELLAVCEYGKTDDALDMLESYWGKMLDLGATSFWEQFDEQKIGAGHYEMYGKAFGKSLCHAWGSGPLYFLGRYVAGVRASSFASQSFIVEPRTDLYKNFNAIVPIGMGIVELAFKNDILTVRTNRSGGVLKVKGQEFVLPQDRVYTVSLNKL